MPATTRGRNRLAGLSSGPVFEVDRPGTQAAKRATLGRLGINTSGIIFVGVDFEIDDLADALARGGCAADKPTLFVWEGVTQYLSAEAVDNTLAAMVANTTPGATWSSPTSTATSSARRASSPKQRSGSEGSTSEVSRGYSVYRRKSYRASSPHAALPSRRIYPLLTQASGTSCPLVDGSVGRVCTGSQPRSSIAMLTNDLHNPVVMKTRRQWPC